MDPGYPSRCLVPYYLCLLLIARLRDEWPDDATLAEWAAKMELNSDDGWGEWGEWENGRN